MTTNVQTPAAPPSEPDKADMRPVLEDFDCLPPAVRFVNARKLSQASQELVAAQKAILQYHPNEKGSLESIFPPLETNTETPIIEEDTTVETSQNEPVSTQYLEQIPSYAPMPMQEKIPDTPELAAILKQHEHERVALAETFQREQAQLLVNYYDGQVREMTQMNDMIDHRPLTEALRYISKRIVYPIDSGARRPYKYNFRIEKNVKKHKKAAEALNKSRLFRAENLHQKELQDLETYSNIHHVDVSDIHIPLVPTPIIPEPA